MLGILVIKKDFLFRRRPHNLLDDERTRIGVAIYLGFCLWDHQRCRYEASFDEFWLNRCSSAGRDPRYIALNDIVKKRFLYSKVLIIFLFESGKSLVLDCTWSGKSSRGNISTSALVSANRKAKDRKMAKYVSSSERFIVAPVTGETSGLLAHAP